jgi:hypothetical protein
MVRTVPAILSTQWRLSFCQVHAVGCDKGDLNMMINCRKAISGLVAGTVRVAETRKRGLPGLGHFNIQSDGGTPSDFILLVNIRSLGWMA